MRGVDLDLVNASDIAERMGVSRQYVAQLVSAPGSVAFPHPLGVAGRTRIWDWGSVNEWLRAAGRDQADPQIHLTYADACQLEAWLRTRPADVLVASVQPIFTKGGSRLIGRDTVHGSFEVKTPRTAASIADEATEYLKNRV